MSLPKPILDRLALIEEKYEGAGQDMLSYLEGLLYSKALSYWDYIHLDTLLSIQNTRTDIPDETIFITYHQITELYFSLILHELKQLCAKPCHDKDFWLTKLSRIHRYYDCLIDSFGVMVEGLDKEAFLQFRMSLLPASGFQSYQYRKIELYCTSIKNLVKAPLRAELNDDTVATCYEKLYWKFGNLGLKSGEKTLTLAQFEQAYDAKLIAVAHTLQDLNLNAQTLNWPEGMQADQALLDALAKLDKQANSDWPKQHMRAAIYHLHKEPKVIKATGGTNWQDYLPPKKQAIHFFDLLVSD